MRTLIFLVMRILNMEVVISQDFADTCLPRIPENFGCSKASSSFTDPEDCNKYITCVPEKDCGPKYMGYKISSCPRDKFYDDEMGECVRTYECPSNRSIQQTAENICEKLGPAFHLENECRKYIACAGDGDTWFWKHKECPESEYFDMEKMSCRRGSCEGCLVEAPLHADCDGNGEGSKFGHEDCTKFLTCEKNPGGCGSTQWGIIEHNCPQGQFFDPFSKDCIPSAACPRECPPKLDNQAVCTSNGDLVEGGDCREVTVCKIVETCEANSFGRYWTTEIVTCSSDEFYNAKLRKCAKAVVCPQDSGDNCPGAIWEYKGKDGYQMEKVTTGDSICRAMLDATTLHAGIFVSKTQKCYIPLRPWNTWGSWTQRDEYEILSSKSTGLFLKNRNSEEGLDHEYHESSFYLTPEDTYAVLCNAEWEFSNSLGIMMKNIKRAMTHVPYLQYDKTKECLEYPNEGLTYRYYLACQGAKSKGG